MPRFRPLSFVLLAAALVPAPTTNGAAPFTLRFARLDVNRLAANASNTGRFGTTDSSFSDGLEFPRGTGFVNFFPLGLWIGANVNGERQGAFNEYFGEF